MGGTPKATQRARSEIGKELSATQYAATIGDKAPNRDAARHVATNAAATH